eukprot:jgi/Undpi1/9610/HiC_scaffold_27.g12066.m1
MQHLYDPRPGMAASDPRSCYSSSSGGGGRPELAAGFPMTGLGEVDATALNSLKSSGLIFSRPRPATTRPARKLCRIFSPPANTAGGEEEEPNDSNMISYLALLPLWLVLLPQAGGGGGAQQQQQCEAARPHTSDGVTIYQSRNTTPLAPHEGGVEAAINTIRHRPVPTLTSTSSGGGSSDSSRRRRRRRTSGQGPEVCRSNGEGMLASTTSAVFDIRKDEKKGTDTRTEGTVKDERQRKSPLLATTRVTKGAHGESRDIETPPNRYWPSPLGPKLFIRPFIERNRNRMWAYDPAMAGMDHVQACQHILDKGNFEAERRSLLEKEDALVLGTGSFLMADTISRFRGGTPGRYGRCSADQMKAPGSSRENPQRATASLDEDPFQCGGCNSDKLKREENRRRDLLSHARVRSNVFCRRKGYEPGDFMKHQQQQQQQKQLGTVPIAKPAPLHIMSSSTSRRSARVFTADYAAAVAAAATRLTLAIFRAP